MITAATIPQNLNPTSTCSCGAPKLPSNQWCERCWNVLPTGSALRYVRKIKSLRSQIINSQLLIAKYSTTQNLPSETQAASA